MNHEPPVLRCYTTRHDHPESKGLQSECAGASIKQSAYASCYTMMLETIPTLTRHCPHAAANEVVIGEVVAGAGCEQLKGE